MLQHMLFATLHSPWCQQLYIYIYIFSFIHTTAYRSVMLESFYGSWECFHVEVERQHPYEVACDYRAGSHRSDSPQITFCVSIGIALCWFPAALLNSYLFIRTRYHLFLSHPCLYFYCHINWFWTTACAASAEAKSAGMVELRPERSLLPEQWLKACHAGLNQRSVCRIPPWYQAGSRCLGSTKDKDMHVWSDPSHGTAFQAYCQQELRDLWMM